MTTILFWVAFGCAVAYYLKTHQPVSFRRTALKTAAVALLAVVALLQAGPWLLVLGLAVSSVGDALLSRETDSSFMAGVGAFAAGHIAFIALFLTFPGNDSALIWDAAALFWTLIILGIVMATLLAPRAGALKGPVMAYIPIILGMGVSVLVLPDTGSLRWALPAALAFIVSDIAIAAEKFLLSPDHPARRIVSYMIWPLYWAAQAGFLIAFTGPFATAAIPH